jgi:hypothetical protein
MATFVIALLLPSGGGQPEKIGGPFWQTSLYHVSEGAMASSRRSQLVRTISASRSEEISNT